MSDPTIQLVNRSLGIAILSNGVEIKITIWLNEDGECAPEDALSCVGEERAIGGPRYWAIDLSGFDTPPVH